MKIYVGTSGYGYKEWKGIFYPEKISPKEMLRFYSERLGAVEINNTFYHMPTEGVLASWAEQVPGDFVFALKAPQVITHLKRLRNVGEETEYLFRTLVGSGQETGAGPFSVSREFSCRPPCAAGFSRSDSRHVPARSSSAAHPGSRLKFWTSFVRGDTACAARILMRIRQMRSSILRHGGTCACAAPIIRMLICRNGWQESFRRNGRGPSYFLSTRMRPKGLKWQYVFVS